MNQGPQSRRDRRIRARPTTIDSTKMDLPGPLGLMTNKRLFIVVSAIFGAGIMLSLFFGIIGLNSSSNSSGGPKQGNEAPDVARDASGTPVAGTPVAEATPGTVKRYTVAPGMIIDPTNKYKATLKTAKGDIVIDLFPDQATQAVNSFVYLANDGYYDNTPFMTLVKNADGSSFTAQAGDPTRTGLGSPGYSVKKEQTNRPFVKGAVGMGGSSQDSNGGQFFIALGDYPALNGKYTIIGQVVSGQDVLDKLALLDLTNKQGSANNNGSADVIKSITLTDTTSGISVSSDAPKPTPVPPTAQAPAGPSVNNPPVPPVPAATPAR